MQFNYERTRLINAWERVTWSTGQASPPAAQRELDRTLAQIEWLLLRYGVSDVSAVASLPMPPSSPLRIHLLGPDSDPTEWATALRDLQSALEFYEGRSVPDEVRSALHAAKTGSALRPYYEWLQHQHQSESTETGSAAQ